MAYRPAAVQCRVFEFAHLRPLVAPIGQRQRRFIGPAGHQFERLGQGGRHALQALAEITGHEAGQARQLAGTLGGEEHHAGCNVAQCGFDFFLSSGHHAPGAIQGAKTSPREDLILLAQGGDDGLRDHAISPKLVKREGCRHAEHAVLVHQIKGTHRARQAAHDGADAQHGRLQQAVVLQAEQADLHAFGPARQHNAHAGDDAKTALGKQAGRKRANAVFEEAGELVAAGFTQGGAVQAAVGQHGLYISYSAKVVYVRRHAIAALQRVGKQTGGGASASHRDQKGVVALLQKVCQHALGHAGLHRHHAHFGIKVNDLRERTQVNDHAAIARGQGGAVAPVFSGADGVHRYLVGAGDAHDLGQASAVQDY